MLAKAAKDMGVGSPADVTTKHVTEWSREQENPRTRVMLLDMLSRFFRWLESTRRIRGNPCTEVERPVKVPKAIRRRFLSGREVDLLLQTPFNPPVPERMSAKQLESWRKETKATGEDLRFVLYCALHAGMRKGEICAARPSWFDLERKLLHIVAEGPSLESLRWQPKDGDNRSVPLTAEFIRFLKSYGLRSPWMLRPDKKPGKWVYRVDLEVPFKKHLKTCGITGCTFHDLRRTFASLHVSAGTPIYIVAKWLGDGIAVVEDHYAHLQHQGTDIERPWRKKPPAKGGKK